MHKDIRNFLALGVKVDLLRIDQVLDKLDHWIRKRSGMQFVVATGMHGIMEARRNRYFRKILDSAAMFVPDGYSLVLLARLKGYSIRDRVTGSDLLIQACQMAEQKGYGVYFYGDTEETLKALSFKLKQRLPDLKIVGTRSPPFRMLTPEEDSSDIQVINNSGADILWVGLGLPKQEQWIYDHRSVLNVPVAIGVGAAFKFVSGESRRAPQWIGNNGFEWLWRLIIDPRRVWRRVLIDGPMFVVCCIKEGIDSLNITNAKLTFISRFKWRRKSDDQIK